MLVMSQSQGILVNGCIIAIKELLSHLKSFASLLCESKQSNYMGGGEDAEQPLPTGIWLRGIGSDLL